MIDSIEDRGSSRRPAPPSPRRSAKPESPRSDPTTCAIPTDPARADRRKTFREVYCAQFDIPIERFENHILKQCLFTRARVLRSIVELFSRRAFSVDRAFLNGFGQARTAAELNAGLDDFIDDPHNRRWIRRELKLRISTRRFLELAKEVMPELSFHNARQHLTRPPFSAQTN